MTERLPAPDGPRIRDTAIEPTELLGLRAGTQLTRIHPLAGDFPVAWNEFRAFGPTASRFDHHPPPPRVHGTRRVAYFTYGPEAVTAALAEFFQDDGGGVKPIDREHRHPNLTVIETATDLRLLDLTSGWVTRAGGNQAIASGARSTAREWARAIHRHHAPLHGLAWVSAVWGPGRCIVLWERGTVAMPDGPRSHRELRDPLLEVPVHGAAERLGTTVAR